jgi:hypothetical protein
VFRDFLSCDPLLFSCPSGPLPCCLDYVSTVVDVPKSGIYDLWAAVEAPYVLGCRASSWSRLLKFHAANRLSPHLARRTNKEDEEWDGAPEELDRR